MDVVAPVVDDPDDVAVPAGGVGRVWDGEGVGVVGVKVERVERVTVGVG